MPKKSSTYVASEKAITTTKGIFITIEGSDGSGKGTQFKLLTEQLRGLGYETATFDFPQYGSQSSYFVRQYLNGHYGSANEVSPYTSSLFFALDRFEAAPAIRQALNEGKVVISNRFTSSNMAHQGTKFSNTQERHGFFIWLDNLEYQMLGIPRPDKSFILRVPADMAQKLVDQKEVREYTDKKRDIHEADLEHLRLSVEVYNEMAALFPQDFTAINCVENNQLLEKKAVQKLIWEQVSPLLPTKSSNRLASPTEKVAKQPNPYIAKDGSGNYYITNAGKKWLQDAVTDVEGSVYATYSKLESLTAAAAMARLSRRGDDMRITVLDEFAPGVDSSEDLRKDQTLLKRVITAYGDDSVQQLAGQHIVVEGASNILTKKLEWGRLGAYLEQSTRYIYLDQRDKEGRYRYYTPKNLDDKTKQLYDETMDQVFGLYSGMVHKLTDHIRAASTVPKEERDGAWLGATRAQACDAIRPVLPVATKLTVGIFASGQTIEGLVMRLLSDELPEAQETGKKILREARKVMSSFLERADKPDRGGATIAYLANTKKAVKQLAQEYLPDGHSSQEDPIKLVSVWPRNELELLPDMLYEHSNLSLEELQKVIDTWPYAKKVKVFQAYMGERLNRRHKPGRALEKAHYSWDLMCDYGIFRDLQRHRMVDDMQWQVLTPRYGYEVPQLVEEAGLSDDFEACFDLSLKLYSLLQEAGYSLEAQYATLLGHRMRWKVTYNAREAFHLHELRTSPQGHPGYRKLVRQMHERVAEVHPMLADAMIFVNKGEDPELSRLAAERYTQFKLKELES